MNKYLIPKNYWKKFIISWNIINYNYNLERIRKSEREKFDKAGFQFDEALKKLDKILSKLGKPDFSLQKGMMESIHSVLFCCVSQVSSINNILEIGTYRGESTLLLSEIFPESRITTIDLPESDPLYSTTYGREDAEKRKKVEMSKKQNLTNPRITFFAKNSFYLPSLVNQKFDLIWIDGGHSYPDIAWDVCNAYHLCNSGGWIMCDDVFLSYGNTRGRMDSYDVLEYVRKRTGDEITYFLKRLSHQRSTTPKKRKYVAIMHKV